MQLAKASSLGIEGILSRHFVEEYYSLVLLPACRSGFSAGWLTQIITLMSSCEALYYAVLACAASHLHLVDSCARMQDLALTYYSTTLAKLSRLLADTPYIATHDGILMSIIWLSIHGCMGRGTYPDVPCHLDAAKRVVTSRFLSPAGSIASLFDILAIESVLYHSFHATAGLWSDPGQPSYRFDLGLWTDAERLLRQSDAFDRSSGGRRSPVLGVPVSLLRLALSLTVLWRSPSPPRMTAMTDVGNEVQRWEEKMCHRSRLSSTSPQIKTREDECYRDSIVLYILSVSLLWMRISQANTNPPSEASNDWQVKEAVAILQRHAEDDLWARFYMCNWPTYTLGFFASSEGDRGVARGDLQRRWDATRLAQAARYVGDLEASWASRDGLTVSRMGFSA